MVLIRAEQRGRPGDLAGTGTWERGRRGRRSFLRKEKERDEERSEEKNKVKTQLDSELCYDGSVVERTKKNKASRSMPFPTRLLFTTDSREAVFFV